MPRTRISYAGRGALAPRADTESTAGLALDRRVDVTTLQCALVQCTQVPGQMPRAIESIIRAEPDWQRRL